MPSKLEQREEMKRQAMIQSVAQGLLVAISLLEKTSGWPEWIAAMITNRARLTAEGRVRAINATPAKWFRSDRPRIDPRRKKRFEHQGIRVAIVHPVRQSGKSWVVERLRGDQ